MKTLIILSLFLVSLGSLQLTRASPYDLYFDTLLRAFIRQNEKYIDPLSLDDQAWIVPIGEGVDVTFNFTQINLYGLKRMYRSGPIEKYTNDAGQNVMDVPLASTNVTLQSVVLPYMRVETKYTNLLPVGINTTMDKLECLTTVTLQSAARQSNVQIRAMDNFKVTLYNPNNSGLPDILFKFLSYGINGILKDRAKELTQRLLKEALENQIDNYPPSFAVEEEKDNFSLDNE